MPTMPYPAISDTWYTNLAISDGRPTLSYLTEVADLELRFIDPNLIELTKSKLIFKFVRFYFNFVNVKNQGLLRPLKQIGVDKLEIKLGVL